MLTKKMVAMIFVLGLMLVAAPVMAQGAAITTPSITIDDLTDTLVVPTFSGGFGADGNPNSPTIDLPGTTGVEHVDWEGHFNSSIAPTGTLTFGWNLYEAGPVFDDASTNDLPLVLVLSDTLQIIITPGTLTGFNTDFLLRFFSDYSSTEDSISPLNDATGLLETGSYQSFSAISGNTDYFDALVRSDVETVPEPCTLLLLGSGLIGLYGGLRRKFKK